MAVELIISRLYISFPFPFVHYPIPKIFILCWYIQSAFPIAIKCVISDYASAAVLGTILVAYRVVIIVFNCYLNDILVI
jgi:hypothetical protein